MNICRFGILIMPSANRVYAEASAGLLQAELEVLDGAVMGGQLKDISVESIGGVRYLTFIAPDVSDREVRFLSNLSSIYALFRINEDGALVPVGLNSLDRLDDDIITIQKYAGKTNEHFTKMLLNVTVLSSSFAREMIDRPFRVFDPLCGRGTTLNQALMYGYNADGLDIDGQDFDAYSAFIRTWLKRKRIKHAAAVVPVRREHKIAARKLDITFGLTKEQYRDGDKRRLTVINADTTKAGDFFKPASFDVIVADAPYGVRHGSQGGGHAQSGSGGHAQSGSGGHTLSRRPLALLTAALPAWTQLLRPGGAVGISWNTYVARRDDAAAVFAANGLEVMDSGPYLRFRHRVDQAIIRDIIVARKPSGGAR